MPSNLETTQHVIIYEAEGVVPAAVRAVTNRGGRRTTVLAVDPAALVETAVRAVDDGADRVELCGALGIPWHARVLDAVGDRAAVGAVMFGFESLEGVAAYKARFGTAPMHEAFLYLHPGADPSTDRTTLDGAHGRTSFVAAGDATAAAAAAAQLVGEEEVRLIELYGGVSAQDGAEVIAAVAGRAPVGVPSYPAA